MGLNFLTTGIRHHPSETHWTVFLESGNKLLQTITKRSRCLTSFNLIKEYMHLPSLTFITGEDGNKQENGGKSTEIKITSKQDLKRSVIILNSKCHWIAEARHITCNIIYVHFESVLCCHMKQEGIRRNSCAAFIPFTHFSTEIIAVTRSFGVYKTFVYSCSQVRVQLQYKIYHVYISEG